MFGIRGHVIKHIDGTQRFEIDYYRLPGGPAGPWVIGKDWDARTSEERLIMRRQAAGFGSISQGEFDRLEDRMCEIQAERLRGRGDDAGAAFQESLIRGAK